VQLVGFYYKNEIRAFVGDTAYTDRQTLT